MVSVRKEDAGVLGRYGTVVSRAGAWRALGPRRVQAIAAMRRTASSVVHTAFAIIRKLIRAAR